MRIEILGMGCQKCSNLYENTKQAAIELGMNPEIVKVEDIKEIMKYGVMTTPALVVDGVLKVAGKVPGKEEIKGFLK
ncbi:redox-active disulphide protein 2 [Lucifera butyrica]|uniref:Redox-active disulphide protein 2 n=1 Tax=Lucifera butyrica TaxID=1351585 RepID=A0A498R4V1_9FIRM|nr:thioredoxin family protein [Lucifera butyrica]VBB06474.1 redox-active disulphide protein 2 [Lucifera butyrica]